MPRMRKLRPERGSACRCHPKGLGAQSPGEPSPLLPAGTLFSLLRPRIPELPHHSAYRRGSLGPQPGWAWQDQVSKGEEAATHSVSRAQSHMPARRAAGGAVSGSVPQGLPIRCLAPFHPHDSHEWEGLRWEMNSLSCATPTSAQRGRVEKTCPLCRVENRKDASIEEEEGRQGDTFLPHGTSSGAPLSLSFGSSLSATLAEALPFSALSFPICIGQEGLGASLSSAIRSGPELVNSRAGRPPQLVKGSRVAGGPLLRQAGARVAFVPGRGGGLGEACFVISGENFPFPAGPSSAVGWGWGHSACLTSSSRWPPAPLP